MNALTATGIAGIVWHPEIPLWLLIALAAASAVLLGFAFFRRAAGTWWRALGLAAALLTLANPSLVDEERDYLNDIAVLVIDQSPSQAIGERSNRTEAASREIQDALKRFDNLDLRVVAAGSLSPTDGTAAGLDDGTNLFATLDRAVSDIPRSRLAGTIMITDGQVHDVPTEPDGSALPGPVHILLTGRRDEVDRRLVVDHAPAYGIVGQELEVTIKIEDRGVATAQPAEVTIRNIAGQEQRLPVQVGEEQRIAFPIDHGGPNVLEISVNAIDGELSLQNNHAVVVTNGVRDRLRVLLVSGQPHAGERVWRNLLKADPSVDLVHFTILRPPEKQDGTPIDELSLIAFPIRELFEIKLDEFDLIIFDRYRRRGVLPRTYMSNIVQYVERGGAFLEAAGPAFATALSLSRTPLADVLPGKPTGEVFLQGFRPSLTQSGRRHPVTADLPGTEPRAKQWGRWFRMVDADQVRGTALMSGVADRPVLILDRFGDGRVAQLLSDHAWLWARGHEGGGPQAEMLRRLAHWLMKEPDLEEESLIAMVQDGRLKITRRSVEPEDRPITVTAPSGETAEVELEPEKAGRSIGYLPLTEIGLHRLTDGRRNAVAAVGPINPREFADPRTSDEKLKPVAAATGGGIFWLADSGVPDLRRVRPERAAAGRNWLGLTANKDYVVTGVHQLPLMPALLALLLILGSLFLAWRREGR